MKTKATTLKALIFFILLTFWTGSLVWGQDVIVKINGDEIKAKVSEITDTSIKYHRYENLTGPVYSIAKAEVFLIRYENGTKDVFNNQTTKVSQNVEITPTQSPEVQPTPVTVAIIPVQLENEDYGISKFSLSVNPLGFLQFGPTINAGIGVNKNMVIDAHLRFPSLGVLTIASLDIDDPDELDNITGIALGGGLLYFFGQNKNKPYFGAILGYNKLNTLYLEGDSWEWYEHDNAIYFLINGGYRFRFNNKIFLNTGAFLGVYSNKWEWGYSDSNVIEETGNDIKPLGMLELSIGIEF